jgi:spore germination protein
MRIARNLRFLVAALVLLLGLSLWWGYDQYRQSQSYALRLENNYQRAFAELVSHLQSVENELAKLSVASSQAQEAQQLSVVWREISAARDKVGQLPLGLVSLDETEAFLSRAGDYLHNLTCSGTCLSSEDRRQIDQLQQSAAQIGEELTALQATILEKNLRWVALENSLLRQVRRGGSQDNSVVDGLRLVNEQVQEFPEVQFDQRIGVVHPPPTALHGDTISEEEARTTALWFLSPQNPASYQVLSVEKTNGNIPTYSFVITPSKRDRRITVEVTQQLGRVLWMLDTRQPETATLPTSALRQRAERFLRRRGFRDMRLVGQHEYQGSVLFAYVFEQDGVLVYPDLLRVRVARDNGDIIGFEGNGYTAYHRGRRDIPQPALVVEDALERLSQEIELIGPPELALIFNGQGQETLVYELPMRRGNDHFLIYVDAVSGEELQIVRLEETELPYAEAWTAD